MFARVAIYTFAAFAALARSTPVRQRSAGWDTGTDMCCDELLYASVPPASTILAEFGMTIDGSVMVGLKCSTMPVGGSGTSCSGNIVCCENDNVGCGAEYVACTGGLISVGCLPISL
ncbi:hypothetical protein OH77DRAFT_1435896 [Trametes cingulata]|nr:hypothetical protein OH77DRAFT_1435896 [Trametes cingulata]